MDIAQGLRKSIKITNLLFYSGDKDKYKFYRNYIDINSYSFEQESILS